MISIGHMARTYGLLPSQVLENATTFDIMITDVYATWEKHEADKAAGRAPSTSDFTQEQLMKAMEKTRNGG
jgi:hypothetical protein